MCVMSAMRVALLVFALPLLVAGCVTDGGHVESGHPPRPEGSPVDLYRIVRGDVLAIDGGAQQILSKESVRVDENGDVNLLFIGKVKAEGKTSGELEEAVNGAYRESGQYEDPQVTVTVLTLYYYVDGQVVEPGRKQYMREITLYRAIVAASGFTPFAAPARVRLIRQTPEGETKVYVINVRKIMGGAPDDVVILPNDIIRVPKSVF
jgi:protein involved in polysaccharide export with SLBB domain